MTISNTEFISIAKQNYLVENEELPIIMRYFYGKKIVQTITKQFSPVEC